jgi:PHD/YefM family antitoxin component YafN of YafNO toxin-antitoxin module
LDHLQIRQNSVSFFSIGPRRRIERKLASNPIRIAKTPASRSNEVVSEGDIQVVSNEAGELTAVIVPIARWKEIASGRETAYLLKSETMRQHLRAALERGDSSGVLLDDL